LGESSGGGFDSKRRISPSAPKEYESLVFVFFISEKSLEDMVDKHTESFYNLL